MRVTLTTPVRTLPRIGATTEKLLKRLGIHTTKDALWYFPMRYEDFRNITPIGHVRGNSYACIRGRIKLVANRRSFRKHLGLTEALIEDTSGSIKSIWFNQPYLAKTLAVGSEMLFAGRVDAGKYGIQFVNPVFEQVSASPTHTGRIVPIYNLTQNLSQKIIRSLIKSVLPLAVHIKDPLPDAIRKTNALMPLPKALEVVHFPVTLAHAKQARNRLALQELIDIYLQLARVRKQMRAQKAIPFLKASSIIKSMIPQLPFSLTSGQRQTVSEIIADIQSTIPMNRLLNGDVGSGKTVIANLAALAVVAEGAQAAFLAPTDILAMQHFSSFCAMFPDVSRVALFTRTKRILYMHGKLQDLTKKQMLKQLTDGVIRYCIGTHAIIQKDVIFKKLGMVIIDEQHRFGVHQRATAIKLHEKMTGFCPHYLSLTATPIPRSLARIFFGGADISVLAELPKGRIPITTALLDAASRGQAYDHIRKEVAKGHQAFVICPIIEESDKFGVKAATKEFTRLQHEVFPDLSIGLVHGKQPTTVRDSTMRAFSDNSINIIVATAVVEVGVDVPNATVMLIEGAERFGLAQLHQFRGRIGRSTMPSTCFVVNDTENPQAQKRLQEFSTTTDGFALAQKDLLLRGPGTIFGILQSGYPMLKLADFSNAALLEKSQLIAKNMIAMNPKQS